MKDYSAGILVHGGNHFIVRGPMPDSGTALALIRHWSLIQIGGEAPAALKQWTISSREFREDLEWAIVVEAEGETSAAVAQLLAELVGRGIEIKHVSRPPARRETGERYSYTR